MHDFSRYPRLKAICGWLSKAIKGEGGFVSYFLTVVLMVIALWLRLAIAPLSAGLQYVTFFPAVTLAAIIGGYRAGLLATLIGLAFATFIFTPPYYTFSVDVLRTAFWSNVVFLFDGLIVSFSIEGMHRYRKKYAEKLKVSRAAHASLLESELREKLAIESYGAGLWDWDLPSGAVYFSPTWKGVIGYAEDEIGAEIGEWDSRIHPEDKATVLATLQDCLDGKTSIYTTEYRFRSKNGSFKWMHDRGVVVGRSEDGKPLRMLGMQVDVTERKQIELSLQISEAKLRAITDNVSSLMFLKDSAGRYLYINRHFEKRFNISNETFQGKTDFDIVPREMAEAFLKNDQMVFRTGQRIETEELAQHEDGVHYYASVKIPIRDLAGNIYAVCGVSTDITERKNVERDLRVAATAFESMEGMMITDANKVILRVNKAFTQITGYSAEEAVGKTPQLLQSGNHDAGFYRTMWRSIAATGRWQGEVMDRRKNGEVYPKWLTISAVTDADGRITNYVGTHYDITDRKRAAEKIETLAFFDQLTGLPNRTLLQDRLKQAKITSIRNGSYGVLLFIDLDNFKTLNDTRGHDVGDLLLKQVAQRLLTCVREGDTVARLGGDEFVMVLTELGASVHEAATSAETVANKVLAALGEPYEIGEVAHQATASIGGTLFRGVHTKIDELMKQADMAMYRSKDAGRNTFHLFDPAMQIVILERAALDRDLRQACDENHFVLHYQAQVSDDGRIAGAEVLVRWQHPLRGMVSPAEFIPLAEETGLILQIGQWVLETACRQLAVWSARPEMAEFTIAVNVSAHQFKQPDFVENVLAILRSTGANPQKLKLELTESLLVENVKEIIEKMFALKAKGVGFSLDDFGTGYSSLSYLKRLPLEHLKIDQSFVRDVLTDPNDAAIAKTIVALAHSLGLGVIAEGVETASQRDFLASAGCHMYQGYFFSKPLPVEDFEVFARAAGTMADV